MNALFTLGAVVGGSLTSMGLSVLGNVLEPIPIFVRVVALVALGSLLALKDLDLVGLPLPQSRRQVPQSAFNKGVGRASARFGFELGTGVRTYLSTSAPYALASGVVLLDVTAGMVTLAGVGFGLGRALTFLTWSMWNDREHYNPARWGHALKFVSIACIVAISAIGLRYVLA